LKRLDERISLVPDTNGDSILLTGTVASRDIIRKAVEATVRFIGDTTIQLGESTPQTIEVQNSRLGEGIADGEEVEAEVITSDENFGNNDVEIIVGTGAPANIYTEAVTSPSTTRIINLLVAEDELPPAPHRLEELLADVHPGIRVKQVNNVFVLNGTVDTAAQHVRALVLADRFVGGDGDFDFTVVSDRGGVLAGDLTEQDVDNTLDGASNLNLPQFDIGGSGTGGNRSGSNNRRGRGGGSSVTLSTTRIDPKGNLGQNVQRADVITIADGRVISMIRVLQQPRVEVQLHIVSIDKDKSRDLGVDFDVVAENGEIVFRSLTGGFTGTANLLFSRDDPDPDGVDIDSFIRALETHGAAKTLAEPTLTTVSGEAATFLVGGNLPIPTGTDTVVTTGVVTTIERAVTFIEFGLRLVIRPTVLETGKIGMVLDQELIEPDEGSGIVFQGATVPGFTQRSVRTVTESYDDETWAVAGLISQENIKSLSKVPFLSDIPIIGELFKIRTNSQNNNELIITVTARELEEGLYGQETLQDKMRGRMPGVERDASIRDIPNEDIYVDLTDFAAAQMQLPESERMAVDGFKPVDITRHPVRIIDDRNIKSMPLAAWEKQGHFVTVIQFVNVSGYPREIDPEILKGDWISVGFDHHRLMPKDLDESSTLAYLVSNRPFFEALNSDRDEQEDRVGEWLQTE
ncbi:MAG: DUF3438 family protein, partial [Thiotrichales bacterium]|nr:DUF3438 family protein [Thiotrichales bacterium]